MISLKDISLLKTEAFINGKFVGEGCEKFDVIDPATQTAIASVSGYDRATCNQAIECAYLAQKSWAKQPVKDRTRILRKFFDLIIENTDDLATLITREMGKPFSEAKGEVAYSASYVEWFAEEAKRTYGDTIPSVPSDKRLMTIRQPVGVVASITPWNFPLAMIARKIAPALSVGCTIVARPSELTPLSALALAVLADRAGIPPGVLNVVPSKDAVEIGKELCENPKVAKLTFTGSTRVGKILMSQCASGIKRMSMELGGNAPFIVFEDADIDAAVEGAIIAKYRNAGQTCVCANRIFVHSKVHAEFMEKLVKSVSALKVGNGMEPGVQIGPMINAAAVEKTQAHLSDAVSLGGKIECGGTPHPLGGNFYVPTVVSGATDGMKVTREETFGPLAVVFQFNEEEEALALANKTEFGLAGYFYSKDMARCFRVAEALEVGMVGINTGLISNEASPFGGIKQSGNGREGSKYGVEDYTEIKSICFGEIQ